MSSEVVTGPTVGSRSRGLPPGLDLLPSGRLRARYRDSSGAFRSRTWPRVDGNIREAVRWRNERMSEVAAGTHPEGDHRVLFADYAADRVAAWRRHKDTTRAQVDSHLRNHVLPYFGDRQVGAIRTAHVEAWVAQTEQVIAPSTLRVVFAWLNRIMADAVRERLIRDNPCTGVELPEMAKTEVVPLDLAAADALFAAMPDHLRATVMVAAWSGLRQGEVLGLRRHRLTLMGTRTKPASIHVVEQLQTLNGPPVLVPPKTKKSVRRVPIPGVLVEHIAAHLADFPAEPEGFIFTTRNGTPVRRNGFGEHWRRAVEKAGLPKGTKFHALRHGYASMLIEAGESVTVVSKRLGHASAVETLETYSHMWSDSDEHTVSVLDAAAERHLIGVTGVSRAVLL